MPETNQIYYLTPHVHIDIRATIKYKENGCQWHFKMIFLLYNRYVYQLYIMYRKDALSLLKRYFHTCCIALTE